MAFVREESQPLDIYLFIIPISQSPMDMDFRPTGLAHNHAQVSTTGQQTLAVDGGDDMFAGAIMFATFSINGFSFMSTEEYDPVDKCILVGASGGILGEMLPRRFVLGAVVASSVLPFTLA